MYHKKLSLTKNKKPARWIARILPSGHFSCGRIPSVKDASHYNPKLLEYKRKICLVRTYSGSGYDSDVQKLVYFQRDRDGHILGQSSPPPTEKKDNHCLSNLSSVATPCGLTDSISDGTQNSLGGGEEDGGSAIGLSTVPSSRIPRQQGVKGITSFGRKVVREGCCVLTKQYKKTNLGFYTLTLPYRGETLRCIVKNWAKLVNRYFEELGRLYERRGAVLEYVAVFEIQEKRYEKFGEVAPHIHYVANAKLGKNFIVSHIDIRNLFKMCCQRYTNEACDFSGAENCQLVKRDAGKYLSKYFSKGGKLLADIAENDREMLPRRWHKVSQSVKACIEADTIVLYDSEVFSFISYVKYCKQENFDKVVLEEVFIEISDGCDMLVGYWGVIDSLYSVVV